MSVSPSFDEPTIPRRMQRPLAAMWVSLGLHAAVIALVQVVPPSVTGLDGPVIEARLVSTHAAPATPETPDEAAGVAPLLASSTLTETAPVAQPKAQSEPAQPAAANPTVLAPAEPASRPATPVAIASSVDLTYYSAHDLDELPRALREIVPDYPQDADRQRISGTVRLKLKLEADGRVMDAEVVSSMPPGVFDDAAIKAFRAGRFAPAMKNGRPVRSLILIEVAFDWEGRPPQPGTGMVGR